MERFGKDFNAFTTGCESQQLEATFGQALSIKSIFTKRGDSSL
jgi:hypothetical protein